MKMINDPEKGPGFILEPGDIVPINEDHPCTLCQQVINIPSKGMVINAAYVSQTFIHFPSDASKYSNQIYGFDFKLWSHVNWPEKYFNAICFECLIKEVDAGRGWLKPQDFCFACKTLCWSEHDDLGSHLSEIQTEWMGYGSRYDGSHYKFINLQGNHYYCYSCLDQEIDEGRVSHIQSVPDRPHSA